MALSPEGTIAVHSAAPRPARLVYRWHRMLAYAGVKVGPKAIARMAKLVAPQMQAAHAAAKQVKNTATIPVMYIEGDGTGVPVRKSEVRGRKAKSGEGEAKTREVKLGCVFTQTSPDSEGKPQRDHNSTTYVGTLQCSEDFGRLLRREAFARGFASAQKTVYLGDGAAWVWEVARINFPQAICILDFYHDLRNLPITRPLHIGSGVVEAGCKTVVGKRMKNSGMFWSVRGAQNILDLRTALLSGRFDDLWLAGDQRAA